LEGVYARGKGLHFVDMNQELEEDDIPEMDIRGGVRGKYYEGYQQATKAVLLDPDLADVFRDSATVNQALREYLSEHGTPPKPPGGLG
jgi:hypothetical protein